MSRQYVFILIAASGLGAAAYIVWLNQSSKKRKEKNGKTEEAASISSFSTKGKAEIQAQCEEHHKTYLDMSNKFVQTGLDVESISTFKTQFRGTELSTTGSPGKLHLEPKAYSLDYPGGPFPDNSVRLSVLPLDEKSLLSSAGESITREVLKHFSFVKDVFRNKRENYHLTVWHTSKASYPCPDATHSTGGVEVCMEPGLRPGPSKEYLESELAWHKSLAASTKAPLLEFSRFVFADSGCLLMTWTDPSGVVDSLRESCRSKYPGSTYIKQSNILHVSLLRLLSAQPLDEYTREKILATCKKWTTKCRGMTWQPSSMWYVLESEFSTIVGERHDLPFKNS